MLGLDLFLATAFSLAIPSVGAGYERLLTATATATIALKLDGEGLVAAVLASAVLSDGHRVRVNTARGLTLATPNPNVFTIDGESVVTGTESGRVPVEATWTSCNAMLAQSSAPVDLALAGPIAVRFEGVAAKMVSSSDPAAREGSLAVTSQIKVSPMFFILQHHCTSSAFEARSLPRAQSLLLSPAPRWAVE